MFFSCVDMASGTVGVEREVRPTNAHAITNHYESALYSSSCHDSLEGVPLVERALCPLYQDIRTNAAAQPPLPALTLATNLTDSKKR